MTSPPPFFSQYRKKPVTIFAKQMKESFTVKTLEGIMQGNAGDYLIIGTHGEKYPCKKNIFESNYEKLDVPREAYAIKRA